MMLLYKCLVHILQKIIEGSTHFMKTLNFQQRNVYDIKWIITHVYYTNKSKFEEEKTRKAYKTSWVHFAKTLFE